MFLPRSCLFFFVLLFFLSFCLFNLIYSCFGFVSSKALFSFVFVFFYNFFLILVLVLVLVCVVSNRLK